MALLPYYCGFLHIFRNIKIKYLSSVMFQNLAVSCFPGVEKLKKSGESVEKILDPVYLFLCFLPSFPGLEKEIVDHIFRQILSANKRIRKSEISSLFNQIFHTIKR